MAAKILLIDNDVDILHTLCQNLIDHGYDVAVAHEDHVALEFCSNNYPDLIILNLHFATLKMTGLTLCYEIRKNNRCPILVLSTDGPEDEKIKALDMGADDCLDLPVNHKEFMAHIRSALRRWTDYAPNFQQKDGVISCGDLRINVKTREVTLQGQPIRLTRTEFDLLKYLAEHRGIVVTHSELSKAVSKSKLAVDREYLRVYISQLRHKIEAVPLNPYYILTEAGVGYRFRI